jgi:uncharacterized protein YutE (UPF0331/DUF86 family)
LNASHQRLASQRIRDRLADVPRHLNVLDAAIALFDPAFDAASFRSAAASSDPTELAKANQVQAAFENVHNHLIGLARGIVELKEWDERADALTALRRLKEHGVITEAQRNAMQETQIIRHAIQHAYHDVVADELREAAETVELNARGFIHTLIVFLESEGIVRST